MLQKNLTHGEVSLALHQYLTSLFYHFARPYTFNVNDKLIDTKFSSLLKKMPGIEPGGKFMLEYSVDGINEPLESGLKLFPSMRIAAHSGSNSAVYELVVKGQFGERTFSVESDDYEVFKSPVKEMLRIQDGEETPSEPITFDTNRERRLDDSIFYT